MLKQLFCRVTPPEVYMDIEWDYLDPAARQIDTISVEEHLVRRQANGWRLFEWRLDEEERLCFFYFKERPVGKEETRKRMVQSNSARKVVDDIYPMAAWQLYFYENPRVEYHVRKGTEFGIIRVTTRYADLLAPGDPVVLTSMKDMGTPVGYCEVIRISRLLIREWTDGDRELVAPLVGEDLTTPELVRRYVASFYDSSSITLNTELVAIRLRATEDIHCPPKPRRTFMNVLLGIAGVTLV